MAFLFTNQTANGTSSDMAMTAAATLYATGEFDGATVAILVAAPSGDFQILRDFPGFNTPSQIVVEPIGEYELRAVLGNAGANTDVSIEVVGV